MSLIKRYANRKLYDTESRSYVTLEDLAESVRRGDEVRVVDHVTGEDLTAVTLGQILCEEEKKIGGLLPQVMLTRLIQTGSSTMGRLHNTLLDCLNPEDVWGEELHRRMDALVAADEISADEAARLVDLLLAQGAERLDVILETHAEASPAPEEDAASSEDVQRLLDQLAALEKELKNLSGES
ncbi:MAG: polyhydroxyalkanoate synthesis regulator DNA-binding domain-containing protein [Anaerolineaceae bacterium]